MASEDSIDVEKQEDGDEDDDEDEDGDNDYGEEDEEDEYFVRFREKNKVSLCVLCFVALKCGLSIEKQRLQLVVGRGV